MKKMYYNPKTEAVELLAGNVLAPNSIADPIPGPIDAPARQGNPLQGQIKM